MNGFPTEFKLDTGASVSVLSDQTPFLKTCELDKQSAKLIGPGGIPLTVIGTLRATLAYKNTSIQEMMYVLRNQKASLLSKSACVALQIISRIDEISGVSHTSPNFKAEFPRLFKELGRLNTDYHITLQPSAERSCLYTARKVPHPLLEEVKKELDSMLKQGVISPVTVPTEWCSGMVPVPKPGGRVRICVGLTKLNQAVMREVHPMMSVDESLAKLRRSSIFTKLDANCGF